MFLQRFVYLFQRNNLLASKFAFSHICIDISVHINICFRPYMSADASRYDHNEWFRASGAADIYFYIVFPSICWSHEYLALNLKIIRLMMSSFCCCRYCCFFFFFGTSLHIPCFPTPSPFPPTRFPCPNCTSIARWACMLHLILSLSLSPGVDINPVSCRRGCGCGCRSACVALVVAVVNGAFT